MRKGRHPSRVTQTGALRKAKCEEKEKGDRCQKTSDAARTPFFLSRRGFEAKQKPNHGTQSRNSGRRKNSDEKRRQRDAFHA
jgi:hypothetical protein